MNAERMGKRGEMFTGPKYGERRKHFIDFELQKGGEKESTSMYPMKTASVPVLAAGGDS